jgi:thiamine pyrophosphokinase
MYFIIEHLFGTVALITSCIGVMPQIYKSYITKSSQDVSMIMLVNFLICSISWIIYGHFISSDFVIYSNYLGATTTIISIWQKNIYDKNRMIFSENNDYEALFALLNNISRINGEYKSIICLNGAMPTINFFNKLSSLPVIAVDGASKYLHAINIKPKMIIGDLDSHIQEHFPSIEKILLPDQNYCDFDKTIKYLSEKNLLPAIITGMNGGYLDQIIKNFSIFANHNFILYDNNQLAFMLHHNKNKASNLISLSLPINTKISIIGCPDALISSKGLKWELDDYKLSIFGNNSTSNRTLWSDVSIQIYKGSVIIFIYFDQSN